MSAAHYALVVSEQALRSIRRLSQLERREARRLFRLIQLDPWLDNEHKILLELPPVVLTV